MVFGRNLPGGTPDPSAVVDGRPLEMMKATVQAPGDPQALNYRGFVPPGSSGLDGFDEEINPRNQGRGQAQAEARNQFFTRTDDPGRYRFVAPADGRYDLLVSSREAPSLAGPRHLYRVRITAEQPDFRLVVMPS